MIAVEPQVGDVLAVYTGNQLPDELIRAGAVFEGQSGLNNHIVVVHHATEGVWWGLEGKPGGVGWADLTRYLNDPHTTHNCAQPKDTPSRDLVAKRGELMLGTPYDWAAITDDTLTALHLPALFTHHGHDAWPTGPDDPVPAHVVCSSLAAYLYAVAGLAHPGVHPDRLCTPADWTEFNLAEGWGAPRS